MVGMAALLGFPGSGSSVSGSRRAPIPATFVPELAVTCDLFAPLTRPTLVAEKPQTGDQLLGFEVAGFR